MTISLILRFLFVFALFTFFGYRSQKDGWILLAGPLFVSARLTW